MEFFPGITAILADVELIDLEISSASDITLDDFTPGAGSNSYKVTKGPGLTLIIFPLIPKSLNVVVKRALFSLICFSETLFSFLSDGTSLRRSSPGRT